MAVFNVPVVIGVDEEKITREIEKDVKRQCINGIREKVEDIIFERDYRNRMSDMPIREMVKDEIRKFMESKEDIIIERAAELLADKLSRTKRVRDKVDEVMTEVLK